MTPDETKCFEIYRECVNAIHDGVLIRQVSSRDKEFHFQNWCQERLNNVGVHFEGTGRNIYPDFCLVERPEGYEIKGIYSYEEERIDLKDGELKYVFNENMKAVCVYLEQN